MGNYKVCAVVVTYNIGKKYAENFNTLCDQVDKVIIVDNGSNEETINVLQELQKRYNSVEVIFNNENSGIGAAQNIGIKKALEECFDWILLLDHDSKLSPNMVSNMLEYYDNLPQNEKIQVGMIAPNIYDINLKKYYTRYIIWKDKIYFTRTKCNSSKKVIENVVNILASGSLIKSEVFKKVGLMREDYFMYTIDTEFSFRLLNSGFKNVVLCNIVLNHEIGNQKNIKFLKNYLVSYNYDPIKYYYLSRNKILFLKDAQMIDIHRLGYVPYQLGYIAVIILSTLLYENNKVEKLYFIFKGLYDGLRGKRGKLKK